jgi:von Willebrand factor type A domain.
MRIFYATAILVSALATSALAQSGRRVAATPTPNTVVETEPDYSETVPLKKRPPRISPLFRGVGINAKPVAKTTATAKTQPTLTEDGDEVVTVETNLVTIPISVFDRNGLYIPNLTKENFKVFDNGVEQEIEYFGTSEKPFTVVLLIDTSPSTEYKIDEIRLAARAFVDQLKPQDKVAVIEFDGNPQVLTKATGNREQIYKAISKADFGGGTALYDAVDLALKEHLGNVEGRKAVVLFTDGVDTQSSKASYDSTLDLAEEFDAPIFPIYYNTFFETARQNRSPFPGSRPVFGAGRTAGEYAMGKKYLEELSAYTGGRIFVPESTPGGLTAAFEGIAEELGRQYNIGYTPTDGGTAGQRRSVRIRVDRKNLVVRSRDSYIVGANK